jgi:hypothetical protein
MATISINGENVQIPDFAMEATLQRVANATGMSQGILTSIMRGNKISAAGLQKMESHLSSIKTETKQGNQEQKVSNRKTEAQVKAEAKARRQEYAKLGAGISQGFNALAKGNTSLTATLGPALTGFSSAGKALSETFGDKGVGKFIGGLTSAFTKAAAAGGGFALGIADTFAQEAKKMAQISGGGLYGNMLDLRTAAGDAGLYLRDLTNALEQSSRSVSVLGGSVDGGMKRFTDLSSSFAGVTRPFGDFGFAVAELNSVMLEEIEIMQRMGMSQEQVNRQLQGTNEGLGRMLYETTAMANLTGADRREMIRARMAERRSAVGGLRFAGMDADEQARAMNSANVVQAMLGDELGPRLTEIANAAAQSGMSMEVALKQMAPELVQAGQLMQQQGGPAFADIMRAYIANDVGAISGMGDQMQSLMGNQNFIQQMTQLVVGGSSAAGGANTVLSSIQQLNQSMQALRGQDLNNLQLQNLSQAEALGTRDRDLQKFISQLLTKMANTEIMGFTPGDAEATNAFAQSIIERLGTTMGLGEGNLAEGFDAAEVTAAVAFLVAQQSMMGGGDGDGGGDSFSFFGGGDIGDGKGKGKGKASPGKTDKWWKNLARKVAGGTALSVIARGAGTLAVTLGSMVMGTFSLPVILGALGVAAVGTAGYFGYKALTGDEAPEEKTKIETANKQALQSVNAIKRSSLGSIMAGFDPANGEADLMTRLGVIMEKAGTATVAELKQIQLNTFIANGKLQQSLDADEKFYRDQALQQG